MLCSSRAEAEFLIDERAHPSMRGEVPEMLPVNQQITFLYCQELAPMAAFYEGVLGLELVLDQGSCRIYQTAGQVAYLGICQRAEPRAKDGVIFTIVTDEVDQWYQRIVERGWTCEHAPRHNATYGIYHFFVRDPNGYLIEVQRFDDPRWNRAEK